MKIRKEPIREDRYLNLKLDTYPVDFTVLDSMFYDLTNFSYCIVINDGEQEIFLEYASSKQDALQKHKEHYDRLILRPAQWFDVKKRKFRYVKYKDVDVEEKLADIKTIEEKDLYKSFIYDAQQIVVRGSNNGLTHYTKREATAYSRRVAFSIFSGLRVKVGQLRNTSYAELKQTDVKMVETFVNQTDMELATRFLSAMYDADSEEHQAWEMFIDLVEAKIAEYYREGNRTTGDAPNYIILEEIAKEVDSRIALTRKPEKTGGTSGGGEDKADWNRRFANNKPGKFYVDEKCIVCDACAATAPKFFKLNEQHAYVTAQPQTPEEIELCNKALAGCPVAAIGNDGDVMAAGGAAKPAAEVKEVAKPKEAPKPSAAPVAQSTEIKPEDREKEIENMKSLLETVSFEKLAEIKAMLQAAALEQQAVVETPAEEAITETPVEEAPVSSGGGKALPATSPDGSAIFKENVPGMFYVDEKCIECDACVGAAPNFFVIEGGHAYVFAQPTNDKEIAECQEAMGGCPVDAIHINE